MLKTKYHTLAKKFWNWYIHRIIQQDFSLVKWNSQDFQTKDGHSLLVLANHCSWWDGFWLYELNRLFLKKEFHVMMLEEQLAQRQFLRYAGAYSINRGDARSMMETLQYTNELLDSEKNMVLMFPQGRIESIYNTSPTFEKGVWRILQKAKKPVQLLYCINTIDYMAEKKPQLTLHLHSPESKPHSFTELKQHFEGFYASAREKQGKQSV